MAARRSIEDQLWSQVDRTESCWVWQGYVTSSGYGRVAGRVTHRLAYELLVGPIPDGLVMDHKCHNRLCCNPDHLQAVSNSLNLQNQSGVYRSSKTGVRGVSFDPRRNHYNVRAAVDGRRHYRGPFVTLDEARQAAIALRCEVMTNNLLDLAEVKGEGRKTAIANRKGD